MNRIAEEVWSAVEVSCRLLLPPLLLFAPSKKQISNPNLARMPFCLSHHTPIPRHPVHVSGSGSITCRPPESPLRDVRSQPAGGFNCGPHSIPCNLLASLHALLRRSLNVIVGLDGSNMPFSYSGQDLSLLVLLAATKAVKLYCGVDNASAPFF